MFGEIARTAVRLPVPGPDRSFRRDDCNAIAAARGTLP